MLNFSAFIKLVYTWRVILDSMYICRFDVFVEICIVGLVDWRWNFSVGQAGEHLEFEHPEHIIVK